MAAVNFQLFFYSSQHHTIILKYPFKTLVLSLLVLLNELEWGVIPIRAFCAIGLGVTICAAILFVHLIFCFTLLLSGPQSGGTGLSRVK